MKRVIGLGLSALLGCSGGASEREIGDDEAATTAGPVTAETAVATGSELKVRANLLTVWVDAVALPATDNGKQIVRITGRASRNLKSAFSYVPDDAYAKARVTKKRGFEVVLETRGEQNALLSGASIFLSLVPSTATKKESYTARIALEPRFGRYEGSSKIFVQDAIKPIYYRDNVTNLRYRGNAALDGYTASFDAYANDEGDPVVTKVSSQRYQFDWTFTSLMIAADPPKDAVHFLAMVNGFTYAKSAGIDLAVSSIGLTSADAYDVWPSPQCEKAVKTCVKGKPASTIDYGECGTYGQVAVCLASP